MSNLVKKAENKKQNLKLTTLSDVALLSNLKNESEDNQGTMAVIAKAEERAHEEQRKNPLKHLHEVDRHYAKLLHKEADQLYLRRDYEAALVLYHKATNICPQDSSHSVAARRTMAAISSAANPSKALRKLLPNTRNGTELSATLCPEVAAIRAENILKQSTDPTTVIPQILEYFDSRSSVWKLSHPLPDRLMLKLTRSQIMQRQLTIQTELSLNSLRSCFKAGDFKSTLKIGRELISLASGLQEPDKYLVEAHHCLALIEISVRRHDRAVNSVFRMMNIARSSGDGALFTKSLVTLGVVHLSFDHIEAACRAWEFLFPEVKDLVPRAWILHEIGRCHLECGRHSEALKLSFQCQEAALKANSKKWLQHGKLLSGQSFLKLGQFERALEALKVSAKINKEEGDSPTLSYIQNLINRVSRILRHSMLTVSSRESVPSKGPSIDKSCREKTTCTESEILKDHQPFRDTIRDKMLQEKPHNEISSIKSEQERENDHSITTRTYVVNGECDLESITRPTDEIHSIQKDQNQIPAGNSLKEYFLSVSKESSVEMPVKSATLSENNESGDDSVSEILEVDDDIRNLFEQLSAMNKQSKDSSDVSEKVEILGEEGDHQLRIEVAKSVDKFEVDTDLGLDFVKSQELEDFVDATESIQTGRTYSLVATHALYRHTVPSSPR